MRVRVDRSRDLVRVRLAPAESQVLEQVLGELQRDLEPDALDAADPVRKRLYPAGYADAAEAQAFSELTEAALRYDRSERLDDCLAELLAGRTPRRTELNLDADATQRWLKVVNDLRLTFGTRLGITDDEDYLLHERDPQAHLRALYLWLTALQDLLVTAVMD